MSGTAFTRAKPFRQRTISARTIWEPIRSWRAGKISAARHVTALVVSELVAELDVVGSEVVTGPEIAGSDAGRSFLKMFPTLKELDLGEISPV
jgi:hypothetical protein